MIDQLDGSDPPDHCSPWCVDIDPPRPTRGTRDAISNEKFRYLTSNSYASLFLTFNSQAFRNITLWLRILSIRGASGGDGKRARYSIQGWPSSWVMRGLGETGDRFDPSGAKRSVQMHCKMKTKMKISKSRNRQEIPQIETIRSRSVIFQKACELDVKNSEVC